MAVWAFPTLIARSEATKQSSFAALKAGLLRFARNDGENRPLLPTMRRLNEAAIVRRADQYLVHANPRRHAGDKGDGAAAIFRLQHFGLLGLARHYRPQFQNRGRDLAGRQAARAQTVDALIHVEGMG